MKLFKLFTVISILIFGILAELQFANLFYADVYVKKGKEYLSKGDYTNAIFNFDKAVEKNPSESFYYRNRAYGYASMAGTADSYLIDSNILKKLALNDLEIAYSINPKNLRLIRNSIPVYYLLSLKEQSSSIFVTTTKSYFELTKKSYPLDVGTLVDIAVYEKKLNWMEDYYNTLGLIQKLRPDILEWCPELLN